MATILAVDDNVHIINALRRSLATAGHQVVTAANCAAAMAMMEASEPDLVLLDVMLPDGDGLTLCREIRKSSLVPIIMLTARDSVIDKMAGLNGGADDYLVKPIHNRELVARVEAHLRRVRMDRGSMAEAEPGAPQATTIELGALVIHPYSREVFVAGIPAKLRTKEFDLLVFLARHPRQLFSPATLLQQVWGYKEGGDARTVFVHIRRLRSKLESDPSKPQLIETIRGGGYRLIAQPAAD